MATTAGCFSFRSADIAKKREWTSSVRPTRRKLSCCFNCFSNTEGTGKMPLPACPNALKQCVVLEFPNDIWSNFVDFKPLI